jgi:lipopolysaccharide transport system permease protein
MFIHPSYNLTDDSEAAETGASQNSMSTLVESLAGSEKSQWEIAPPRGWFELNLREMWNYRELLYFFVWRDLKIRYKQTAIGVGWVVLQPLMAMLLFTVFFGRLAKMPSEGLPYPVFYYTGLLPWLYFSASLTHATNTVVEHERVITKVYFPKMFLPFSAVLSGLVDFGIGFVLLLGMMLYYHLIPTIATFLVPIFLLLAVMTALAVGLWLSALNAIYRDVRYVIPFLVQFWLFASPVVYPSTVVPAKWRWLYGLNPMAGVVEGFRWAVTGRGKAPGVLVLVSATTVLLLFLGGVVYFKKMESKIADTV